MCRLERLRTWFLVILEGSSIPYRLPCEYYQINRSLYMISGLWPFQSKLRRLLVAIFFNLVMYTVLLMLMLEVLVTPHRSISYVIKCSIYIIPTASNITAYNALSCRNETLSDLWIEMQEFWNLLETEDEIRIAENFVRETRDRTVILIVFIILFDLAVYTHNMFPLLLDILVPSNETRSHRLAAPIYIPIDEEKYYVLIYLAFVVWGVVFSLSITSSHSISLLSAKHMCASLEIIGHVLTVTPKGAKSSDTDEQLIRGIQLHKKTLQLVDVVNKTWEYTYLTQVGYAALFIISDVLHVFNLRMISKESLNETLVTMLYVISSMVYILIAFHVGQNVVDASFKFYQVLCTLPWYEFPVKTQKLLMLMILRSKKSCYLSVGKTYKISYELYASIFRKAVSIGMMIYSLR